MPRRSDPALTNAGDLVALAAFTSVYLVVTAFLASRKVLWTDELVTMAIARLPRAHDVWNASLTGGDTLPPLGAYLTRLTLRLVAQEGIGARLPAIVGYWTMCVALYWTLRRYVGVGSAAVAMLFPTVTAAYPYAYEARPYGLLMGFAGLALLCWDRAGRKPANGGWLLALAAACAGAVASHWYGLLIVPGLACGQFVRMRRHATLGLPVWAALAAGSGGALLALLPIVRHAQSFRGSMAAAGSVGPTDIAAAYQAILGPSVLCVFLLLLATAASAPAREQGSALSTDSWELAAAACGLALIPLVGAVLSSLATGVYAWRYLLPATAGVATLVGLAVAHALPRPGPSRLALALVVAASFVSLAQCKRDLLETSSIRERQGVFSLLGCGAAYATGEAIVVPDVHAFYSLQHYAPPALAGRLAYVTEFNAIGSQMSNGMRAWSSWTMLSYEELRQSKGSFLLYDGELFASQTRSELIPRLLADGATLRDAGCAQPRDLYPRPGHLYRVQSSRPSAQR